MAINVKRNPELLLKQLSCLNLDSLQNVLEDLFSVAAVQNGGYYPLKKPFLYYTDAGDIGAFEDAIDFESHVKFVDAIGPLEHLDIFGGVEWPKIRGHEDRYRHLSSEKNVPIEDHMQPGFLRSILSEMDADEKNKLFRYINRSILNEIDSYLKEDRMSAEIMLDYFHHCMDGKNCVSDVTIEDTLCRIDGISFISDPQQVSSGDFIPGSAIEKAVFEHCGGQSDVDYLAFTAEMDGFQSLVWMKDGHYECSDWIYDTFSHKLEKFPYAEKLASLREEVSNLYDSCSNRNDAIVGDFAKEFVGKATWSKGIDFYLPGLDALRGLRFVTFGDKSIKGYILNHNGDSKPVAECSAFVLNSVMNKMKELKRGVRKNKAMRGPVLPW